MANMSRLEMKILKKVAESQLITKMELQGFLRSNGSAEKDISRAVESAAKSLIEKSCITAISPVGSTCYIITQKGARMLQDLEE